MRRPDRPPRDHGAHTLRVMDGVVVGVDRDDVFVELGPRMQGVIPTASFDEPPAVGDVHRFTLGGQEEGLWALSLTEEPPLSTWEDLEPGSVVEVRVVRTKPGGLEVKIGPLHAFLPKSQTGLDRSEDPEQLVGKSLVCEVTEVDAERQRCSVSRKLVVQRERESERQRAIGALAPGRVVQGRVSRIERYGVFLRFGHGLEGMIHVSDLAWERVDDPAEHFRLGQHLDAKVLSVKRGGKRIGLGLKQLGTSPWTEFARAHAPGDLVRGSVSRVAEFGLFVVVAPGVEGLVHRSETGQGSGEPLQRVGTPGSELVVRVLAIDPEAERLSLSLLLPSGQRLLPEDGEGLEALEEGAADGPGTTLGPLLSKALGRDAGSSVPDADPPLESPREHHGEHEGGSGGARGAS